MSPAAQKALATAMVALLLAGLSPVAGQRLSKGLNLSFQPQLDARIGLTAAPEIGLADDLARAHRSGLSFSLGGRLHLSNRLVFDLTVVGGSGGPTETEFRQTVAESYPFETFVSFSDPSEVDLPHSSGLVKLTSGFEFSAGTVRVSPRIGVGWLSYAPSAVEVLIKEQGANEIIALRLTPDRDEICQFGGLVGLDLRYPITSMLGLSLSMEVFRYESNLRYTLVTDDVLRGTEIARSVFDYSETNLIGAIGLGFYLAVWPDPLVPRQATLPDPVKRRERLRRYRKAD